MTQLPHYAAMLATAGQLPADDDRWAYEMKYDGLRAIAYVDDRLLLESRNGNEVTSLGFQARNPLPAKIYAAQWL